MHYEDAVYNFPKDLPVLANPLGKGPDQAAPCFPGS